MLRILLLAVCLALTACSAPEPSSFRSTDITGADYGKNFHLTDHTGRPRSLTDFRGKVVTLFFGYTQCPDVCPTSLAMMAEAMRLLGPQADQVQVLFVTVDPERDSQDLLSQYVPAFDPRFLGLYTDPAGTEGVARDFKIFFRKQGDGPHYTVDHSAGTYVYDPAGRLRLYVRHGETAAAVAEDIRQLLAGR